MNCEFVKNYIEALALEDTEKETSLEISEHLQACEICMNEYQRHLAYLTKMQAMPTPSLHPTTAAKMLREAVEKGQRAPKKVNSFVQGFIAASVLAIAVMGTYSILQQDEQPILVQQVEPEYIDQNVTIVIHANEDFEDAELDLVLPERVAIAGFDNIQQLTWPVDLKAGANTLELPIRVNMDKSLEQPLSIMATLYHNADERNFEIDIDLNKG
ncbi:MAG: anti-sigma factor family protein [Thalassotalea sp.]